MITIATRDYEVVCQIQFEGDSGLIAYEDVFEQPEESDLSSYSFRVGKTSREVERIEIGQFVYVRDGDAIRVFEIMRLESDNDTLHVYAIDAGLDFVNEEVGKMNAEESYPLLHYVDLIRKDSGWEIGKSEIPSSTVRKLSYEGKESSVSRLRRIANEFDAEVEYTFELDNTKIVRKLINIYKKGSRSKKVRLEYGVDVSKIEKTESIEKLVTALEAVGIDGITLQDYVVPEVDKSEWAIVDNGILVHIPSTKRWNRYKNKKHAKITDGYILGYYDSEAKTQKTLYDAVKNQILKRCVPEVTYTVEVSAMPERLRRGDVVIVSDYDYKPALAFEGRVSAVKGISFADGSFGTITITNIDELDVREDMTLRRMSEQLHRQQYQWNNAPYQLTIRSSNGTVFQNRKIATTLSVDITKNGIDMSQEFSTGHQTGYFWKRISKYGNNGDAQWNQRHDRTLKELTITADDVENGATFLCEALINGIKKAENTIVITDLTFETATGVTPPKNPETGMIWIDTSTKPSVQKIYLDNQWVKVVDETDVNALRRELTAQVNSVDKKIDAHQSKTETAVSTLNQQSNTLKTNLEITEQQLRLLREQQALAKQELQARATLAELEEWKRLYQAFVAKEEREQKNSEQALVIQSQRIETLTKNLGQFKEQLNFLSTYTTFSEEGVTIGKKDGSSQIRISQDRISMYSAGKEVMYLSQGVIHIDNGVFTKSLQIGYYVESQYESNEFYNVIRYVGPSDWLTRPKPNLLDGTRDWAGFDNATMWEVAGTYNGLTVMKNKSAWYGRSRNFEIIEGRTYTFSAYVRCDATAQHTMMTLYKVGDSTAYVDKPSRTLAVTTTWQRVSHTFTALQSVTINPRIQCNPATPYIYICGLKIEENDKATDWVPSVRDGV